ncbi:unnamed protein product, partial [Mesorhabditis spiculigera]
MKVKQCSFKITPPFRVLIDGTFCMAALRDKINLRGLMLEIFGRGDVDMYDKSSSAARYMEQRQFVDNLRLPNVRTTKPNRRANALRSWPGK